MRIAFDYEASDQKDQPPHIQLYDLDTGDPIKAKEVKFAIDAAGLPLLTIIVIPDHVHLKGPAVVTEEPCNESANCCAQPVPPS